MQKRYVVRLTDQERSELQGIIKKLKGTGQKVRRAQILLKADTDGTNWTDERIADAFSCRTRTVEKIRQRLVERGFEDTLHGVERAQPPVEKLLTGDAGEVPFGLHDPLAVVHFFDTASAGKSHCRIPVEMDMALWQIQSHSCVTNWTINSEIYTSESVDKTCKPFKIELNVVVDGKRRNRFDRAHQLGCTVIEN